MTNKEQAVIFHRSAVSALKRAYDAAGVPLDLRTVEIFGPEINCPSYSHYKLLWLRAIINTRLETETDETQIKKLKTRLRKLNKEIITSAGNLVG